jgi:hypothetical protein
MTWGELIELGRTADSETGTMILAETVGREVGDDETVPRDALNHWADEAWRRVGQLKDEVERWETFAVKIEEAMAE